MVNVFGIRHHGPGSAKSLVKALEAFQPDCILIEAPADAQEMIKHINDEELVMPAAILLYAATNFQQTAYFPFATFSPEWQAIVFGRKHQLSISFIDLPMARLFCWREKKPTEAFISSAPAEPNKPFIHDPISYIAQLAGYTDSERWWEVTFEQTENDIAIFETILEMMGTLREALHRSETEETLLREAHMRQSIRQAARQFQKIAVVCGAWHAPVLHRWQDFKKQDDEQRLKALPKGNTKATWIPWSYERLAFQAGYGAGVLSPAWYELLFDDWKNAGTIWLTVVAQLLRTEKLDASAADVLEANRLANALATLRGRAIPGIDELQEAAVTVICKGEEKWLELIQKKAIIGQKVGHIPNKIASLIQQDFEKTIKSLRLTKEYQSVDPVGKKLDLRKDHDRAVSYLLHRLLLLDIPFGELQSTPETAKGSYWEIWTLKWQPDFSIHLIEAGMWGSTISDAAFALAIEKAQKTSDLSKLTALAQDVLNADLPKAIAPLLQKLQDVAALTKDVLQLMDSLQPMVSIIKYGNVRKTDALVVEQLVMQIIPRICIGLPGLCIGIDEELSSFIFKKLIVAHHSIYLLNQKEQNSNWLQALIEISRQAASNERLRGLCIRLLFDKNAISTLETNAALRLALSPGQNQFGIAHWLEGFLYGSGLVLIHNPPFWQILDDWLSELPMAEFEVILPVLRRAFTDFSAAEREQMLRLARQTPASGAIAPEQETIDQARAAQVLPTVLQLLNPGDLKRN